MTMTRHKQVKALARHKQIVRARDVRTNNKAAPPVLHLLGRSRSYRLYDI